MLKQVTYLTAWLGLLGFLISIFSFSFAFAYSEEYEITLENAQYVELSQTLTGHSDRVWTVIFSPDGQLLASCDQSASTRINLSKSFGMSIPLVWSKISAVTAAGLSASLSVRMVHC